jgi:hypothetical protein
MAEKMKYFSTKLIEFQNVFNSTESIYDDAYNRGGPREDFVREFLKKYLPKKYGITTGKVIGLDGGLSRQADIIIYDSLNSPIVFNEEHGKEFQIIPAESVISVVEVKSIMTCEEYQKTITNIKSFKAISGVKEDAFGAYFSYSPPVLGTKDDVDKYRQKIYDVIKTSGSWKDIRIGCVLPNSKHKALDSTLESQPCFLYLKMKIPGDGTVSKEVLKETNQYGQFFYADYRSILHAYMFTLYMFTLIDNLNKWSYKKYSPAKYFINLGIDTKPK